MLSENGGSKVGGEMSRKRYTAEQIIGKLREAEVALSQGQTAAQVCRTLGIAEQTFYR
jgi:putative transposase